MRLPRISVVTVSYNQARFIEATLRSVLDQKYPNLEYIVIDGGSTDGSVEIIRRCEGQLHYWISERDNGQTEGLIKGFNAATGDVLCWLNSDDMFEPWTLNEVGSFFCENQDVNVVYGNATGIDVDGKQLGHKKEHGFSRFIWMHDYNYIPQPSTFWRRRVYEEVGGLDPSFDLAMDADLWIRMAEVTSIHHVARDWSRMRLYPEQKNQRLRVESNKEDLVIRDRYLGEMSNLHRISSKYLAKCIRTGWRLASGCYW